MRQDADLQMSPLTKTSRHSRARLTMWSIWSTREHEGGWQIATQSYGRRATAYDHLHLADSLSFLSKT